MPNRISFDTGNQPTVDNLKKLAQNQGQLTVFTKNAKIQNEPPIKELSGNTSYFLHDVDAGKVYLKHIVNGVRYKLQLMEDADDIRYPL